MAYIGMRAALVTHYTDRDDHALVGQDCIKLLIPDEYARIGMVTPGGQSVGHGMLLADESKRDRFTQREADRVRQRGDREKERGERETN